MSPGATAREADGAWRRTPASRRAGPRRTTSTSGPRAYRAGRVLGHVRRRRHPPGDARVRAICCSCCTQRGGPVVSYLPLPHPSGIAFDRRRGASSTSKSTRNSTGARLVLAGSRRRPTSVPPVRCSTVADPLHALSRRAPRIFDLAMVGGVLHGSGRQERGRPHRRRRRDAREVARARAPRWRAARPELPAAELDRCRADDPRVVLLGVGRRDRAAPPGDADFPVDRRGVVFSGLTRESIARVSRAPIDRLRGVTRCGSTTAATVVGSAATASTSSRGPAA